MFNAMQRFPSMPNNKPVLLLRARQSAIVARMMITICRLKWSDYRRKHPGAAFAELLVGMVVRVNEEKKLPPIGISGIAKELGAPPKTIENQLKAIMAHQNIIRRSGQGYIPDPDYLVERTEARYFKMIVQTILDTADELRALEDSTPG